MAGDIKILNIGNERPEREILAMSIAELIALRGTCKRARVGCVITRDGRIISTGYNGSIIGDMHCDDLGCDVNEKCKHAIHAEANAIIFAARQGLSLKDSVLCCTVAPCYECAKLIVQAGIQKVYWMNGYTDNLGINLLIKCGILTERITDAK